MDHEIAFSVNPIAQSLRLPNDQVERTIALLDEGNAIPFITRFRKDQTGGLNENQIRSIKRETASQRALIERKRTIIKSIDSQNQLDDKLLENIHAAANQKSLEDLYLPFRPKRQTLAATARQQGLEPLAKQLLENPETEGELATRALDYVRVDKGVETVEQAYEGVGHLVAEQFGEHVELRAKLRDLFQSSGRLTSKKVSSDSEQPTPPGPDDAPKATPAAAVDSESVSSAPVVAMQASAEDSIETAADDTSGESSTAEVTSKSESKNTESHSSGSDSTESDGTSNSTTSHSLPADRPASDAETTDAENASGDKTEKVESLRPVVSEESGVPGAVAVPESPEVSPTDTSEATAVTTDAEALKGSQPETAGGSAESTSTAESDEPKKKKKKKKKKKSAIKADSIFKDYFDFDQPLGSIPPHRILAINRGERAKLLRVRIESSFEPMQAIARELLVPESHPQREFMHRCVDDALNRLILPSLEREMRRELTENAEMHALKVFAKNLRNLLLQPPLRSHHVLAFDPGYQSGCHYAALDEFGNPLATGILHVVGNAQRRKEEAEKLAETIRQHNITAIGIGNGAACRETEKAIATMLQSEFADSPLAYAIVNGAGASTYSTSVIGREELPDHDPAFRSAISIGRRMLDPLSELVKISPENLGIGMYQHDVKAKHLQEQLEEVVESCVNFVGVNANTASPALLTYVAGLNQLTARRMFEHRKEHGPFGNREQFKSVPGFGDVTFVQAAGFLKVPDGDQPLDSTSIHPESYEVAARILERLKIDPVELVSTSNAIATSRSQLVSASAEKPKPSDDSKTKSADSADSNVVADAEEPESVPPPEVVETKVEEPAAIAAAAETETEAAADAVPSVDSVPSADAVSAGDEQSVASEEPKAEVVQAEASSEAGGSTESTVANLKPSAPDPAKLAQMGKWREIIKAIDSNQLAADLQIGQLTLRDILNTITRPTRDPRESLPKPIFRREILKIEDLEPGMMIRGRVVNVVDFGAFVDIGLGESSLVHISALSRRYIKDPHDVVAIGDLMKLWVKEVDKSRRRITLTAINPVQKPRPARSTRSEGGKPRGKQTQQSGSDQSSSDQSRSSQSGTNQSRQKRGGSESRQKSSSSGRGAKHGRHASHSRPARPAKPPKPVKPITDEMKKGEEPMRSFSDLQQFFKDDPKKPPKE